ncbi:MAG: efflux RND transporter periplasmic adaptor subunit [Chloroflexi bacterium]|nr:efflux RND transporter periplasmic adaptor subunit [Chloroflexota bacterium]
MKRRTIVVIVIILAVAAFVAARFGGFQRGGAASLDDLQFAEIEFGSLVATVGATGTVRSNQTATLVWQSSGSVEGVDVRLGDQVQSGDRLANLAQNSLPQNVILAQAELVIAQNALEDLHDGFSDLSMAAANQQVALAVKALESAERLVNNLNSPASQLDIDQAKANVVIAESQLQRAEDNYAPYENKPEDNLVRASLLSRLAQAQQNYDLAVRQLNALEGTTSDTNMAVADADFAVTLAQLTQAHKELERLAAGATEDDIAAAQARIAAAIATLNMAQIEAPFAGTITQAVPMHGDQVSPGMVAFRLDDLSRLLVDVQISEVDINRIQVGQAVTLTFDAILAKEYQGEVVEVGLVGTVQQGIVNFQISVELIDPDEEVRPGMTAAVNVVVSQLEDVLLVPNRAVRVLEGERVVYILTDDNQLEAVVLTLGSSSDTHSQILESELAAGDEVILNPPTQFQGGPGGGGPFGGGG